LAAPTSAFGASPFSNQVIALAFGSRPWRAYSWSAFSESKPPAEDPAASHFTLSALRPLRVALTVSPITATPKGNGSTFFTPGIFIASSALTCAAFAPSYGASSTDA
jgi:hypothetical protein